MDEFLNRFGIVPKNKKIYEDIVNDIDYLSNY